MRTRARHAERHTVLRSAAARDGPYSRCPGAPACELVADPSPHNSWAGRPGPAATASHQPLHSKNVP